MNDSSLDHVTAAERAGVRIRAARDGDADAFASLLAQPGVRNGTLEVPWQSPEVRADQFRARIRNPLVHMLVAELADSRLLVGQLSLSQVGRPRRSHVASLAVVVDDAHHGRGIGTALVAAALHLADEWLQVRRVELKVDAANERAIGLYGRFGFQREGTRRGDCFTAGVYGDTDVMGRVLA